MGIDYIARAEENMRRWQKEESSGIDRAVDHYVKVAKTQAAIQKYIREMAEVLAAAAVASEQAVGDRAETALLRWMGVLGDETRRLIREKKAKPTDAKALTDGKTIEGEKAE